MVRVFDEMLCFENVAVVGLKGRYERQADMSDLSLRCPLLCLAFLYLNSLTINN